MGGAVRDELMGNPITDRDYAVIGAGEAEFLRAFPKVKKVGRRKSVYLYAGDEYTVSPCKSIHEDLLRRDLTINAFAKDAAGRLYAHPKAHADLKNKMLRPISTANFLEDPLRLFRAARFAAQLPDFQLHATYFQIAGYVILKGQLAGIAAERIGNEVRKACAAVVPSRFFYALSEAGLLPMWFSELSEAVRVPAGPAPWHHDSVFSHSMSVADQLQGFALDVWMGICHDLGKIKTDSEKWPSHHAHEKLGEALAEQAGTRLRLPSEFIRAGAVASRWHMPAGRYDVLRASTKVTLLLTLHKKGLLESLFRLTAADTGKDFSEYAMADLEAILAVRLPEKFQNSGPRAAAELHQLRCRAVQSRYSCKSKYPNYDGKGVRMAKKSLSIETLSLHAGHVPDSDTLSRAVPIYQTTSYMFKSTQHAADLFALKEPGFIYSRIMNPTTDVLEKRLAAIHDASAALVTASGMSAIFYAVTAITAAGQNFVSGPNLYGGTRVLFENTLKRFGIEVRFVDSSDPKHFEKAIDDQTRLLYTETIGNPRCNVDDLSGIAAVARKHKIPFVLDNTVAPPPVFDPIAIGADIIVYSLTKMIGGHGNSIGGAVVEAGGFDWAGAGKYSEITSPDPSYHGINFWEALCTLEGTPCTAFCTKLRTGLMRDIGAALAPVNSYLILQGMETLPLRARAHCENANKVAAYLNDHPSVTWVNYAGLANHPNHARAKAYFPHGPGAVFGFGIKGGRDAGCRFIESVKLCSHLANILDAKTLVIHPATTTHSQLSTRELAEAGVSEDMIRISVGIENVDDIIADLDQALQASQS